MLAAYLSMSVDPLLQRGIQLKESLGKFESKFFAPLRISTHCMRITGSNEFTVSLRRDHTLRNRLSNNRRRFRRAW